MKNVIKLTASVILISSFLTSCVVPATRHGYARQGYNQQVKHLKSVTVNKRQTGHCEAQIIAGPDNTPQNVDRVAAHASQVYMKTGSVPSEGELTQKFGFRTQARWVDTPDRIVQSVTVSPDELPENIRRQFQ